MNICQCAAIAATLSLCGAATAAPLDLILQPSPDIFSSFVQVDYSAETGLLQAAGFPVRLAVEGGETIDINPSTGSFDLDITVDSAGNAMGGSFSIMGDFLDGVRGGTPGPVPTLVEGTLSLFGFAMGSETLEFIFDVTGGTLAADYGDTAGVLLADSGFDGDWSADFSNTGNSVADTAPPIPAPAPIIAIGTAALVGTRRRSR